MSRIDLASLVLTPPDTPRLPHNKPSNRYKNSATSPTTHDDITDNITDTINNNNNINTVIDIIDENPLATKLVHRAETRGRPRKHNTPEEQKEARRIYKFNYYNKDLLTEIARLDGDIEDLKSRLMVQQRLINEMLEVIRNIQ